jgi:hypothetical protein
MHLPFYGVPDVPFPTRLEIDPHKIIHLLSQPFVPAFDHRTAAHRALTAGYRYSLECRDDSAYAARYCNQNVSDLHSRPTSQPNTRLLLREPRTTSRVLPVSLRTFHTTLHEQHTWKTNLLYSTTNRQVTDGNLAGAWRLAILRISLTLLGSTVLC